MKVAYFRCVGGVSGDMVLGALIDCGASVEEINGALGLLGVEGLRVEPSAGSRGAVAGTYVRVSAEGRVRRLDEMESVIQGSRLAATVVDKAVAVLRRLSEAEEAAHRTAQGETHVHELGSMDTLVDVVGAVVGLETLGIERVYCSALPSGSGMVATEHGPLPAPSPATAALMSMAYAPVVPPPGGAGEAGEMVTPTGAALMTTLAEFRQPALNLRRVGYGLGGRDPVAYPNVLALWLGDEQDVPQTTHMTLIETNIDDMTAEHLGYVQGRLFDAGARDVWFTPIQMKKNRPGTMISALGPAYLETALADLLLRETSTFGVRVRAVSRYEADREVVTVQTSLGRMAVKVKKLDGAVVAVSPEFDDCSRVAKEKGLPIQDVYRTVHEQAARTLLSQPPG